MFTPNEFVRWSKWELEIPLVARIIHLRTYLNPHGLRTKQPAYNGSIPGDTGWLKRTSAFSISSSLSKGMSPHTISYNRMPSDQTAADRPWYRCLRIHSGGEYTRVPVEEINGRLIDCPGSNDAHLSARCRNYGQMGLTDNMITRCFAEA